TSFDDPLRERVGVLAEEEEFRRARAKHAGHEPVIGLRGNGCHLERWRLKIAESRLETILFAARRDDADRISSGEASCIAGGLEAHGGAGRQPGPELRERLAERENEKSVGHVATCHCLLPSVA